MKRMIIATICIILAYPVSGYALTGLSFGVKVDMATYSGDVLPNSGDIGSVTRWGAIIGFGALPVVDFELRASYLEESTQYSADVGGVTYTADYTFQDAAGYLVLKKDVFAPMASPVGLYLGAGVGVHWLNTEIANLALQGGGALPTTNPLEIAEATAKPSGVGLLGLRVAPPGFPIALFGEASYEMIFATERLDITSLSAGLLFRF